MSGSEENPTDAQPAALMAGRKGLIMGVANEHSIAWGIARVLHRHGAQLALTYQGERLELQNPSSPSAFTSFVFCVASVIG
jgi:enoyl-[acyl-carrier-protein] reductase (NADH)